MWNLSTTISALPMNVPATAKRLAKSGAWQRNLAKKKPNLWGRRVAKGKLKVRGIGLQSHVLSRTTYLEARMEKAMAST
jgi:hypothetical protein